MFIDYAINDISDPDEMASFEVDFKDGGSTSYWSSYDNPAAIKLVHQAQAEFNPQKRAALYAKIQAIVAQDAPFVPLDYPPYIYAYQQQGAGLRGEPGRRVPPRGRLANLTRVVSYIWRRLLSAAFVAVGVTVGTFLLLHVEPGDPARLVLGAARVAAGDRLAAPRVGPRQLAAEPVPALRVEPRSWRLRAVLPEPHLGRLADRLAHRHHVLARRRRDAVLGACSPCRSRRSPPRARIGCPITSCAASRSPASGCRRSGSASC